MPCIHPSETPPLGWLVPCLAVNDLAASMDWYGKFGFAVYGGDPAEKWVMLRSRAAEIHLFQGHIPSDLVNFRGGDVPAIRRALEERHCGVDRVEGPWSVIYRDPDDREVFFDSSPEEHAAYGEGRMMTGSIPGNDIHAGEGMDLGNLTWCFACGDLGATLAYYQSLGMVLAGGEPEKGWAIVGRADHPARHGERRATTFLSLFQGMIPRDTLNFRGGNVAAIAGVLEEQGISLGKGVVRAPDGGESLLIEDPDGRPVLLDTTPPERLY